jgi:hypothetical protein
LPLVSIPVVYRLYQEPVFKNVRLSPASRDFEAKLAAGKGAVDLRSTGTVPRNAR